MSISAQNNKLALKRESFQRALFLYDQKKVYLIINRLNSVVITLLYIVVIFNFYHHIQQMKFNVNLLFLGLSTVAAYILADFINGLIHMAMDNNDQYESCLGPFIAQFHLHHKKIKYSYNNAFLVFFYESGYKIWLVFFLTTITALQYYSVLSIYIDLLLIMFGLLSSFSEVSHYWCHNSHGNKTIKFLQKARLILPMKHHRKHHIYDNVNYAFLNGMTNPLLNIIAKIFFNGYKYNTDLHSASESIAIPQSPQHKNILCKQKN